MPQPQTPQPPLLSGPEAASGGTGAEGWEPESCYWSAWVGTGGCTPRPRSLLGPVLCPELWLPGRAGPLPSALMISPQRDLHTYAGVRFSM